MRLVRFSCGIAILTLVLAACGGPVRNIFPPRASIQQLAVQADGSWKIQLRLQNFSNVSTTFASVDAKIEIAGKEAGTVSASPAIRVGPESGEPVEMTLKPSGGSSQLLAGLHAGNVRYKLSGRIVSSDPKSDNTYTFDGQLSAVPGLDGVFR